MDGLPLRADGALGCVWCTLVIGPESMEHLPVGVLSLDPGNGVMRRRWALPPSRFAVPTPDGDAALFLPAVVPYSWALEPPISRMDPRSGETEALWEPPEADLFAAALSPAGRTLAALCAAGPARLLWTMDLRTGEAPEPEEVDAMALAWCGEELVLGGPAGVAVHGEASERWRWALRASVLAVSGEGCVAWAAGERVYLARPGEVARALAPVGGAVRGLAWSPDGARLLIGTETGVLAQREMDGEGCGEAIEAGIGPVGSVAWLPDGRAVLAGGLVLVVGISR